MKNTAENDDMPPIPPIRVDRLFGLDAELDALPWTPFRPGIEIIQLYGDLAAGPATALLRYAAGAELPTHTHLGYEHIIVLRSSQRDQNGTYPVGTLAINRPGTTHTVVSDRGCVVLAIWEKPVHFAPGSLSR